MAEKSTRPARKRANTRKPETSSEQRVGRDQIAERAYFISLDEGHGDDVENWLRAERELSAR